MPSANLKLKQPEVYKVFKSCYILMASSYIGMEQQDHAKSCIKRILEVEPSDVQALYLRGQAHELRQETEQRALRDYQRAYDI